MIPYVHAANTWNMYQALTFEHQHLNTVQNTNIWTPSLHLPTIAPTHRESQNASWIPEDSENPRTRLNRKKFFVNQKTHCESRNPCIVNPANSLWIHNCFTRNRLNTILIPCSFSEFVNIGGGSPGQLRVFLLFPNVDSSNDPQTRYIAEHMRHKSPFFIFWPMRFFCNGMKKGQNMFVPTNPNLTDILGRRMLIVRIW